MMKGKEDQKRDTIENNMRVFGVSVDVEENQDQ